MRILVIDNYDSFTYNLVHYIEEQVNDLVVTRNSELGNINFDSFDGFVISPGPSLPKDAGDLMNVLPRLIETGKPVLGVCLGLQAIVEHFGGTLTNLDDVRHGIARSIDLVDVSSLFVGMEKNLEVGLYHSWAVRQDDLPACLKLTAIDNHQIVMALKHESLQIEALQFHPESILTPHGKEMIFHWLHHVNEQRKEALTRV